MKFFRYRDIFIVLGAVVVLAVGVFFVLQYKNIFTEQSVPVVASTDSNDASTVLIVPQIPSPPPPPQKLSNPPEIIKAVYMTGYSAGSKKYLDYLSSLFKNTEINAVVVDIKGSSGYVSYNSAAADVKKYNLYGGAIKDIDELVRFFHDQNIYVIGRIAVFEDPMYSKVRPELAIYDKIKTAELVSLEPASPEPSRRVLWRDNNNLSWLDPDSKDGWDYNISLAKDAFYHGFDEMNFDYIRFPSDGNMGNIGYPVWDGKMSKADVVKEFFMYLRANLSNEKISVDLFGQTTTNTDDMGIGQIIENAFENFDYISPMVYPSHYINGFMGFANPADHPYEIIKYSMETALSREKKYADFFVSISSSGSTPEEKINILAKKLAEFRPWLQDFNMGAYYTSDMVRAEIKATQDALGDSYNGFMLWNPSNIYTQDAVKIETKPE